MKEADRISDQLERALEGRAWHGHSVAELLDDLDARRASQHPIEGAHSIWELVNHMTAWQEEVRRRLEGAPPRELPPGEDFPSIPETSEERWQADRAALRDGRLRLSEVISRLEDGHLDDELSQERDTEFSLYATLHGLVQHHLYHAGQIALLKKASS